MNAKAPASGSQVIDLAAEIARRLSAPPPLSGYFEELFAALRLVEPTRERHRHMWSVEPEPIIPLHPGADHDRTRGMVEMHWVEAQRRIAAVLSARGVSAVDADDIIQEVVVRAFSRGCSFESPDQMIRWMCRVAINLHIDSMRRARRLSRSLDAAEEPVQAGSVEDTVLDRAQLDAIAAAVQQLSREDQELLLGSVDTGSRQEAVRIAVRRHRLRARIALMLEPS